MINAKKGSAHSLQQTDRVGLIKDGEGVVAGMVCRVNTSNEVVKGSSSAPAANDLLGFAINNQTDGDVIASGRLAMYLLDGSSVIESDQSTVAINASNYPIGARVYAIDSGDNLGKFAPYDSDHATRRIVGTVEGIRSLPGRTAAVSQSYKNLAGETITTSVVVPVDTTVLGIKLAA
jgi:hypothetical protein